MGNPARYLGGQMISPTYPYQPQGSILDWGKICLFLLLLLPPTGGTEDELYLSILIPGAGRPCLFILICNICGTAVAGRGWCWQRFVHAFPWQQYSWQAK